MNPARGILSAQEIEALVMHTIERGGKISYKNNPDGTTTPYEMNVNYLDALTVPGETEQISLARFMCAQSIMLTLAGVPGIYFHSLFGSRGDRVGAEASGMPRRINREKLAHQVLETELANSASRRAKIFTRFAELLRVRGEHAAFHPHASQTILDDDARVFAVLRSTDDERVLCLHNVTGANTEFVLPQARRWRNPFSGAEHAAGPIALAPYEIAWLAG